MRAASQTMWPGHRPLSRGDHPTGDPPDGSRSTGSRDHTHAAAKTGSSGGGKRKLSVSTFDSQEHDVEDCSPPSQKARVDDDLLTKYLSMLIHACEEPRGDAATAPELVHTFLDLLRELERIMSESRPSQHPPLSPDQVSRLLRVLKLVLTSGSSCDSEGMWKSQHILERPPSSSPAAPRAEEDGPRLYRELRAASLGFVAASARLLQQPHHGMGHQDASDAYDVICKAVEILEELVESEGGVGWMTDQSVVLACLPSQAPSFTGLPLSKELHSRMHAVVFGTSTSSPSASRKAPAFKLMEDMDTGLLPVDILSGDAGARAACIGGGKSVQEAERAACQRAVQRLLDICTDMVNGGGGAGKLGGHEEWERGLQGRDDAKVEAAHERMKLVARVLRLVRRMHDSVLPSQASASTSTITKCADLVGVLLKCRDAATYHRMGRGAHKIGSGPTGSTTGIRLVAEAQGGLRSNEPPSAALEDLLAVVETSEGETDPSANSMARTLWCFTAGCILRSTVASSSAQHEKQRVVNLEHVVLACRVFERELALAQHLQPAEMVAPMVFSAQDAAGGQRTPFAAAKAEMGRSAGSRSTWLMAQLGHGDGVLDALVGLLVEAVRVARVEAEGIQAPLDLLSCLYRLIPTVASALGPAMQRSSEAVATKRAAMLLDVATGLEQVEEAVAGGRLSQWAAVCSAVLESCLRHLGSDDAVSSLILTRMTVKSGTGRKRALGGVSGLRLSLNLGWPMCVLVASLSNAGLDVSRSLLPRGLWERFLESLEGVRAEKQADSSRVISRGCCRLLCMTFGCLPSDIQSTFLNRLTRCPPQLSKDPVALADLLQLLQVVSTASLLGDQAASRAPWKPSSWLDVITEPEGAEQPCLFSDSTKSIATQGVTPTTCCEGIDIDARDALVAALSAMDDCSADSRLVVAALGVLPRLPCPPMSAQEHRQWLSKPPQDLQPLELLDKTLRLAAAVPAGMVDGEAELAGAILSFIVKLREAEALDAKSNLALSEALASIAGRLIGRNVELKDLESMAESLRTLIDDQVTRHHELLTQATGEMWSECDPEVLFDDGVSNSSRIATLARLTAALLRLGRSENHLEPVSGTLAAMHDKVLSLDGQDDGPLPVPPLSMNQAVFESFNTHLAMDPRGQAGSLGGGVGVSAGMRSRQLMAGGKRILRSLLTTAADFGRAAEGRAANSSPDEDGFARQKCLTSAVGMVADAVAGAKADATLVQLHGQCEVVMDVLSRRWSHRATSLKGLRGLKLLQVSCQVLLEASNVAEVGHEVKDSAEGAPQLLMVLSQALVTQALHDYASVLSSGHTGRAVLLSHLLPVRFFPPATTSGIGALSRLLKLAFPCSKDYSGSLPDCTMAIVHMLAGICRDWDAVEGDSNMPVSQEAMGKAVRDVLTVTGQALADLQATNLSMLLRKWIIDGSEDDALPWSLATVVVRVCESTCLEAPAGEESSPVGATLFTALLELLPEFVRALTEDSILKGFSQLVCCMGAKLGREAEVADALVSFAASCPSQPEAVLECVKLLEALVEQRERRGAANGDGGAARSESMQARAVSDEERGARSILASADADAVLAAIPACTAVLARDADAEVEQPWYKCHTCEDMACCSVCARFCHAGHDLALASRFALFRCKCGTRHRSSCKAQTGQTAGHTVASKPTAWQKALSGKTSALPAALRELRSRRASEVAYPAPSGIDEKVKAQLIARLSEMAGSAVKKATSGGKEEPSSSRAMQADSAAARSPSSSVTAQLERATWLRSVRGLDSGSIDVKLAADSSRGRQLKALITSGHARRNVLTADTTGRVAFVEREQVVIASALDLLGPANLTQQSSSLQRPKSGGKSRLCALSRTTVSFQVMGLSFNPANRDLLLVWGLRDCAVYTVGETSGAVLRRTPVDPSFDAITFSGIIKQVRWVPGQRSQICVLTDSSIKVFDVTRAGGLPTHCYRVSGSDPAVDVALVSSPLPADEVGEEGDSSDFGVVMLVLTKSMRLYSLRMIKALPRLTSTLEIRLDTVQAMSLPISNGDSDGSGHAETADDAPVSLFYSFALGMLVVGFKDDRAVGLRMEEDLSEVRSCVPLLSSDVLGASTMAVSSSSLFTAPAAQAQVTTGPFLRWTEGQSHGPDGTPLLLVVGKATKLRSERALALSLADKDKMLLQELPGPSLETTVSLGSAGAVSGAIEGICAAPGPGPPAVLILYENGALQVLSGRPALQQTDGAPFGTRSVLRMDERTTAHAAAAMRAVVSKRSNLEVLASVSPADAGDTGSSVEDDIMEIHAGSTWSKTKVISRGSARDGGTERVSDTSGPVVDHTCIEKMVKLDSESGLELIGCQNNTDGGLFKMWMGARGEGATLAVRVEGFASDVAVVRVLVGATSFSSIPRELSLLGRTRKSTPRKSRWYDLFLTEEEMAMVRKAGMVTLSVSECHESSAAPIVDCIEVYVRRRPTLADLPPLLVKEENGAGCGDQWAAAAVACLQVITTMLKGASLRTPEATQQVLKVVDLVLSETWGIRATDDAGVGGARRAGKELLSLLLPAEADYFRHKDRVQLAHVRTVLQWLKTPQQLEDHERCVRDLKAAVRLISRVLSRRSANLYPDKPKVLGAECTAALLAVNAALGKKAARSPDAYRACVDIAGDVVELVLREVAHIQSLARTGGTSASGSPESDVTQDGMACVVKMLDCTSLGVSTAAQLRITSLLRGPSTPVVPSPLFASKPPPKLPMCLSPVKPQKSDFVLRAECPSPFQSPGRCLSAEGSASECASPFDGVSPTKSHGGAVDAAHETESCASRMDVDEEKDGEEEEEQEDAWLEEDVPVLDYRCDGCGEYPLRVARWRCRVCDDFDLCTACYDRADVSTDDHDPSHLCTKILIKEKAPKKDAQAVDAADLLVGFSVAAGQRAAAPDAKERDVGHVDDPVEETQGTDAWDDGDSSAMDVEALGDEGRAIPASSAALESTFSALFSVLLRALPQKLSSSTGESSGSTRSKASVSVDIESAVNYVTVLLRLALSRSESARTRLPALASAIAPSLAQILRRFRDAEEVPRPSSIAACLILSHAVECLLIASTGAVAPAVAEQTNELRSSTTTKTGTLVCRGHGLPVAKRVWPHGRNQGRTYYGCPLPGDQGRCQEFKWGKKGSGVEDGEEKKEGEGEEKGKPEGRGRQAGLVAAAAIFAETLGRRSEDGVESAVCQLLCAYVKIVASSVRPAYQAIVTPTSSSGTSPALTKEMLKGAWPRPGLADKVESHRAQIARLKDLSQQATPGLLSSLVLLVAQMRQLPSSGQQDEGRHRSEARSTEDMDTLWQRQLCEVIEGEPGLVLPVPYPLKSAAKRLLRVICGGRSAAQRSRDYYVIIQCLDTAASVVKKAKSAGQGVDKVRVRSTELLYTDHARLHGALSSLLKVAKARPAHWLELVALSAPPLGLSATQGDNPVPAICAVLELSCALDGDAQYTAISLLEAALADGMPTVEGGAEGKSGGSSQDSDDDDGRDSRSSVCSVSPPPLVREDGLEVKKVGRSAALGVLEGNTGERPNNAALKLLVDAGRINSDVVLSWMSDTLLAARTMLESRRLCGALLRRLWRCLKLDERQMVVQWLMARLGLLLKHGAHAEEALMLLDDMCDDPDVDVQPAQPEGQSAALSPSLIAERVVSALLQQLAALEDHPLADVYQALPWSIHGQSNPYYLEPESCFACLSSKSNDASASAFRAISLDSIRSSQRATETSLMMSFRTRQLVKRVSLRISEPHGRYVKHIRILFHPNTVASLTELSVPEHLDRWQLLTTLRLAQGQTTAEAELTVPAVVGGLLIEYDEFYPQITTGSSEPLSSRAFGMGTLHCPQCGRQVTDPHGFCRHCGEVAFQCRQCRHINYERFDAFLCVECGYSSYGNFTYRLLAQASPSAQRLRTQAQADDASKLYLASMTLLQQEQERLAGSVGDIRQILREVDSSASKAGSTGSHNGPFANCALADADAAALQSLEAILPSTVLSALDGKVVASGRGINGPAASQPVKAARFVLVQEAFRDPDTESRDEDDDDAEEESGTVRVSVHHEDEGSPSGRAGGATDAVSSTATTTAPSASAPSVASSSCAAGQSLTDPVVDSGTFEQFVSAQLLSTSAAGAGAWPGSRTPTITSIAPAAAAAPMSPTGVSCAVRTHVRPVTALRPAAPSASKLSAEMSAFAKTFWGGLTTPVVTSSAKEPNQRVVDYYSKTCKPIVEKLAGHARDLLLASEGLLAFHEGVEDQAELLQGVAGEGTGEMTGGACSVTTCYCCGYRLVLILVRILLTLVETRRGLDTLMQPKHLDILVKALPSIKRPEVCLLVRQLIRGLCASGAPTRVAGVQEANLRVREVLAETLTGHARAGVGVRLSERGLPAALELMFDLCSFDGVDVASLKPRLDAWFVHVRLPLEILRRAGVAEGVTRDMVDNLLLPCVQTLTAVCSANHPDPLTLCFGSDGIREVQSTVRALCVEVIGDMLRNRHELVLKQATGAAAWTTVEQSRLLMLVKKVAGRWKLRAALGALGEADAARIGLMGERSWWIQLLLCQHSQALRKQVACLLLVVLRTLVGENDPVDFADEDEHDDDDEAEEGEEDGMDEEVKEDQVVEDARSQPSPSRRRKRADSVSGLVASFPLMVKTRVVDELMSTVSQLLADGGHDKAQGQLSLQLFAVIRQLASSPSIAAFLAAREALPFLCQAIAGEVSALHRLERRVLLGLGRPETGAVGVTLLQLVEVLYAILVHPHVRARVARQPHMVASLVRAHLEVKLSLVLRSGALEAAQGLLEDLSTCSPTALDSLDDADALEEARAYLLACVEVLKDMTLHRGQSSHAERQRRTMATSLLLKNMQLTLCPPRKRPRFRIHLRRAPSQEEFFRGSISKNPIWVTDVAGSGGGSGQHEEGEEREPTVRDLRATIANELNMADAVDLLELLATGKILSLDLPLRLVFHGMWRPYVMERHAEEYGPELSSELFPPLMVTYRLAGVDGEATEETVETLSDEDHDASAEASREARRTRLVEALGEGVGLVLLLQLAHPPGHGSLEDVTAWEAATQATSLLRQCAKAPTNRLRLLQLNAPGTLLTSLLAALRLSTAGGAALSSMTQLLLQVIEQLGASGDTLNAGASALVTEEPGEEAMDVVSEESNKEDQVAAFLDALKDGTLVEVLGGNEALTRAVGRLLPFLTYGRESACKTLADRIRAEVDWETMKSATGETQASEAERLRVSVMLESLAGLEKVTSVAGRMLRDRLLENGFTISVIAATREGLPELRPRGEVTRRTSKDKEAWETEWKACLSSAKRLQALRVLTGLSRGHGDTLELMAVSGVLASLHAMEEVPSTGKAGSLAETLLEAILAESSQCCEAAAQAVRNLRKQTREHKRQMAQENRQRALKAMGFKPAAATAAPDPIKVDAATTVGSGTVDEAAPIAAAVSDPGRQQADVGVNRSDAHNESTSMSSVGQGASKPGWMEEMDMLEEESGLKCMVCQEGYTFKPKEVLGLYVHSKTLVVPTTEVLKLHGDELLQAPKASSSAASSRSVQDDSGDTPSLRSVLDLDPLETLMGRSRSSSSSTPSSHRMVSTVTAFNIIHFSCHAEAAKADRALKQPKSEWDGAALRNSRVACNGMLPLRGPPTMAEAYRQAVEKYFVSRMSANSSSSAAAQLSSPMSRFALVVHDLRLLLLRIAFKESLRDDSGGGSLASNLKLMPYQGQLAHYVMERVRAGDAGMGQMKDIESLSQRLTCFVTKAEGLCGSESATEQHERALADAAPFMAVLGVFLMSRDEWESRGKPAFLKALCCAAGLRRARGDQGSGVVTTRRRPRSMTFAAASSPQDTSVGTGGGGRKRRRAMSEGNDGDVFSQGTDDGEAEDSTGAALEAARPMLLFLCLVDELQQRFRPCGHPWQRWKDASASQAFADDEKNVTQTEELYRLFEKELAPDHVSATALAMRLKRALSAASEDVQAEAMKVETDVDNESVVHMSLPVDVDRKSVEEQIVLCVRHGQNLFK